MCFKGYTKKKKKKKATVTITILPPTEFTVRIDMFLLINSLSVVKSARLLSAKTSITISLTNIDT